MNYEDILHSLNLMPLQTRRKYLKLVTMFNIINGHLHFNPGNFTPQQPAYKSRQTSQFNFYRLYARTDQYMASFIPSVINMHGIVCQLKLKHRLLCHLLKIKYCIILVTDIN